MARIMILLGIVGLVGVSGEVASTVIFKGVEATDVLPALVCVAVMLWVPSVSDMSTEKMPSDTVAVPPGISTPASYN